MERGGGQEERSSFTRSTPPFSSSLYPPESVFLCVCFVYRDTFDPQGERWAASVAGPLNVRTSCLLLAADAHTTRQVQMCARSFLSLARLAASRVSDAGAERGRRASGTNECQNQGRSEDFKGKGREACGQGWRVVSVPAFFFFTQTEAHTNPYKDAASCAEVEVRFVLSLARFLSTPNTSVTNPAPRTKGGVRTKLGKAKVAFEWTEKCRRAEAR